MRDQLVELLAALEREMRAQDRWERHPPAADALRSTQPFAVDTLAFDQWLQWVFVPKLHHLLARQLPLPGNCAVGPMAEEVYGPDSAGGQRLIVIIAEIDALLTTGGDALSAVRKRGLHHFLDELGELRLGQGTDLGGFGVATLEYDQGGDAADAELAGQLLVIVHVHLADLGLAGVVCPGADAAHDITVADLGLDPSASFTLLCPQAAPSHGSINNGVASWSDFE